MIVWCPKPCGVIALSWPLPNIGAATACPLNPVALFGRRPMALIYQCDWQIGTIGPVLPDYGNDLGNSRDGTTMVGREVWRQGDDATATLRRPPDTIAMPWQRWRYQSVNTIHISIPSI